MFLMLEKVTQSDIDKIQRDFKFFTKDVRKVNNEKDLYELFVAANRWADYFDKAVMRNMFASKSKSDFTKIIYDIENIEDFIFFVRSAFVMLNDIKFKREKPNQHQIDIILKQGYDEGAWKVYYIWWNDNRDYVYQRLARLGREAFKVIDKAFFQSGKDSTYERYVEAIHKIGSTIVKTVYDEGEPKQFNFVKDMLNEFKKAIPVIEQKGFKEVFENLKLEINPNMINDMATVNPEMAAKGYRKFAGLYTEKSPKYDQHIVVAEKSDITTIIHELGHRYYYQFLPKPQMSEWARFFHKPVHFNIALDLDAIKNKVASKIERHKNERETFINSFYLDNPIADSVDLANALLEKFPGYENYWMFVKKIIYPLMDEELRNHVQGFRGRSNAFIFKEIDRDSFNAYKKEFSIIHSTAAIFVKDIYFNFLADKMEISTKAISPSDYGAENPEEFFAETFMFYCLDKPLKDLVFEKFIEVTGIRK